MKIWLLNNIKESKDSVENILSLRLQIGRKLTISDCRH